MTVYKKLCVELLAALENEGYAHWTRHTPDEDELCLRARAALAEPEPEGPTDEELDELAWNWYSKTGSTWWQVTSFRAFARAVLARWGNPAPTLQPRPVDAHPS